MIEIIEYILTFTYEPIDKLIWANNFPVNEKWEILRVRDLRVAQKSYMNRSPYIEPKTYYDIALYSKNRWYCLNTQKSNGNVIVSSNNKPKIPNIKIKTYETKPYISIYRNKFDFHVMMTLLNQRNDVKVLEFKRPSLTSGLIIYDNMKIEILAAIFSYKGERFDDFIKFSENMYNIYLDQNGIILSLYLKLNDPDVEPNNTHKALAYKTWYKAKRENQYEWPMVSTKKEINSIEFPKSSKVWYYYPNKFVGLAKRNDDNIELLIPRIYNKDHTKVQSSNLYSYIKTGKPSLNNKIKIPHTINNKSSFNIKYLKNRKTLKNEKYIELSYDGEIIETDINPTVVVYKNIILKEIKLKNILDDNVKAQLLDEKNNRIMILNENNEWIKSYGYKIRNIITIPWYYKQIIHDYNKLGRLKNGEITDLSNIGIVDKNGTDIITWPFDKELYVSKTLETHRLMTLKYQKYVEISYLYD